MCVDRDHVIHALGQSSLCCTAQVVGVPFASMVQLQHHAVRQASAGVPFFSLQAFKKVANGPLWFGLPISSISNSQVVLNVNAASLQLVVNASPGKIMFGQVSSPQYPPPLPRPPLTRCAYTLTYLVILIRCVHAQSIVAGYPSHLEIMHVAHCWLPHFAVCNQQVTPPFCAGDGRDIGAKRCQGHVAIL